MPNWYTSRERLKAALTIAGSDKNALLDAHIEGASRSIERELGRRFIPKTQQRLFRWPQDESSREIWSPHDDRPGGGAYQILRVDEDLLSVSTITSENGDLTLVAGDYFLEPVNEPPYNRIEINAASTNATALFAAKTTVQRAIAVTGSWGYSNGTEAAGTVTSGLAADAAATSMVCSNGSLIDVGDTLLIQTEQLFVSERGTVDTTANLTVSLLKDMSDTTVVVNDGTLVQAGSVILIDSERMYVQAVSGNNLTVIRAYDGTVLAAHTQPLDVFAFRTLTVVRGVNGTTAAVHADAAAISRYRVPGPIESLCRAEAIFNYEQDESGQTGVVGGPEGGVNVRPRSLEGLWERAKCGYMRPLSRAL